MKRILIFMILFFSLQATAYPMHEIYKQLDITSFRNSLMPRRVANETRFSQFSLPKPLFTDNTLTIEDKGWFYQIKVIKKDVLGLHVCFSDQAKRSTYFVQEPMLIRRYGNTYVALHFTTDVCKTIIK